MSGAASLAQLLSTRADINFYTQQLTYWTNMYNSNAEKLDVQAGLEEKWTKAYDDAQDVDKTCKIGTTVWKEKDAVLSDAQAEAYANAKVSHYDAELKEELAELDMRYDTMKTMYDQMLTNLRATEESEEQLTSTNVQKTYLLNK